MPPKTWNELWSDSRSRDYWKEPDPMVIRLVHRLKQQGVDSAIDVGCGIGRHVALLASEGFRTSAVDSSVEAVKKCRDWLHSSELSATISVAEARSLPYPRAFCDFILCWNVIYHTHRKGMVEALGETERVLRPNGWLLLTLNSTRNRNCGLGIEIERGTFDNPEKIDGQHLHHYSDAKDVSTLLSGFRIELLEEVEQLQAGQPIPGSWHWTVLARR